MNEILKSPLYTLGYRFIDPQYLPAGKDEYYLRNRQRARLPDYAVSYRSLTSREIEVLIRNGNTSDNWANFQVVDPFSPELVQGCKFFGLIRIGKLEPWYLEFHNLRRPVGLYNSAIISCDFGDNVVVDNVNYLSHYIIGNDVMIVNVNELTTTETAKFGNGVVKEGELESQRIHLELCNENGGRSVIPFNGMLAGDAWLWTRFRDDTVLQKKFREFTDKKFDKSRGHYGMIGDRTVIKNCRIVKDCMIGSDAYLKGANKLKNLTLNSSADAPSQVGEGCELVNGIIGLGCRIFYGAKAVRFVMGSHSQLKYGARLINSYLGDNATISCCEVLNSLIFPGHEQHHNNSFLCASLLMGQSNIAAGATIGSNHNSRSADGELVAGRGFWPGLCVSLKHNSRFASYTLLAKGDFPGELDIPIPFCLVSNDSSQNELTVMPGYWFQYNMYALVRNNWKYAFRDKRTVRVQLIEWDFLAPDTINEMVHALTVLEEYTGLAWTKKNEGCCWAWSDHQNGGTGNFKHKLKGVQEQADETERERLTRDLFENNTKNQCDDRAIAPDALRMLGRELLLGPPGPVESLEVFAQGWENSNRRVRLVKVHEAYEAFRELIAYYAALQILETIENQHPANFQVLRKLIPQGVELTDWWNAGGQLIEEKALRQLLKEIREDQIGNWDEVHNFYLRQGERYKIAGLEHSLAALWTVHGIDLSTAEWPVLRNLLKDSVVIRHWMTKGIIESREKDHKNPFRQMTYAGQEEMDRVIGKLEDNTFIRREVEAAKAYGEKIDKIVERFDRF